MERLFSLSFHLLYGGGQVEVEYFVFTDHVTEQLLPILTLKHVTTRTLHRLILSQL